VTNVGLLASMDRRSKLQLRLQQTVESLSVVAIAYYALGLIAIVFKGAAQFAPKLNPELATGVVAPLVVLFIWRFLRRVYGRLSHADQA
jgi:uncharacterized membrane-anchored protein